MNILDALGGANGVAQMAKEFGVDEKTVQAGAAALLPAVLGGFKSQAQAQPQGLAGLVSMVQQAGGAQLLERVLAPQPTPVDQGNAVLGQIFGSKDVSRAVADRASSSSGVSPDLLRKMLPVVAMAAAGFMAKQASAAPAGGAAPAQGGLGGLVGQVLGAVSGGNAGRGAAAAGGLASVAALLDMDGDGNPLNDIMRMVGGNRQG
ncbi:MAG: DUF937 domain-containing protein [Thermaurantiacus sp.]